MDLKLFHEALAYTFDHIVQKRTRETVQCFRF